MPEHHPFQSTLAVPIKGYIAEKRAVGHKFQKGADLLKGFDYFVYSRGLQETNLTKPLVMEWTARRPNETASTQAGRISLLRGLAVYMNRIGYAAYVYPKAMVTVDRYAYIPYIFSSDELKSIFEVCDQYPFHDGTPNRHLNKGTLSIRYTKFNKERILPMSDNLSERCREYVKTVRVVNLGNPFFFPSPFGGHYSESTVYKLFRDVLRQANISHLGRGKGPRIHDLRHTFAVNCLKKWVLDGRDLNNALPY